MDKLGIRIFYYVPYNSQKLIFEGLKLVQKGGNQLKIIKSFRFWFLVIALGIIVNNYLGYDDKNLLLYVFNLPNLLLYLIEMIYPPLKFFATNNLYFLVYFISLIYWFLIGVVIDIIVSKSNRNKIK